MLEADEAVLVFSSGTTGLPKAVRHTHGSIGLSTDHWCTALGLGPDDRFQVATPPSHILGLLNLLAATTSGAIVRLHRRFDLDEILHRIASERMTLEMAVAPIALALANLPDLEDHDLSSLRYIMWGATPVTDSVARMVTERTGVRWLPAYGASEVPVIAANPVERPREWRLDSAGLPPAGVELRIADLESGDIIAPGGIGEIQVRSRSAMAGYLPDDASAEAFVDGWYRTGDVGWLEPEGWVHLTDRSKEMIKVMGFRSPPPRWRRCCSVIPPCSTARSSVWSTNAPERSPPRQSSSTRACRSAQVSSKRWSPTHWRPTSACTMSWWWTTSRASRRARCCGACFATSGRNHSPLLRKATDGRPSLRRTAGPS